MPGRPPLPYGVALGYLIMLVALSTVFVAIKRRRDTALGGAIRFWPAFGMGLAISLVASLFYVVAWEAALTVTGMGLCAEASVMGTSRGNSLVPAGTVVADIGEERGKRKWAARKVLACFSPRKGYRRRERSKRSTSSSSSMKPVTA